MAQQMKTTDAKLDWASLAAAAAAKSPRKPLSNQPLTKTTPVQTGETKPVKRPAPVLVKFSAMSKPGAAGDVRSETKSDSKQVAKTVGKPASNPDTKSIQPAPKSQLQPKDLSLPAPSFASTSELIRLMKREYRIWCIVQTIREFAIHKLGLHIQKDIYELDNILGRFTIMIDNKRVVDLDQVQHKFIEELCAKHRCPPELAGEVLQYFMEHYRQENFTDEVDGEFKPFLKKHNGVFTVAFQEFRLPMTEERYNRLHACVESRQTSMCEIIYMALRYGRHLATGMQWSVPPVVLQNLHQNFHAKMECFGSPLNNTIPQFGSLYPDVDGVFGSKGDFFNMRLTKGTYAVNPPFIEVLMDKAADKLLASLEKTTHYLRFFIFIPSWMDSHCYTTLTASPYLVYKESLAKAKHFYFDGMKNITAYFASTFMVLESKPSNEDFSQCTLSMLIEA